MSKFVNVLIVDDNPNMRITFKNILSIFDCNILEAETGEEAFTKISNSYFDIIFFDNKLPEGDGIEVIRKVREANLKIGKIFLVTGYPEKNTKPEAQALGVFHFQSKDNMD